MAFLVAPPTRISAPAPAPMPTPGGTTSAGPRRRAVPAPPVGRVAWAAALGACTALEAYSLSRRVQHGTLSEFTRWTFRTQTRPGRAAFALAWVGFSAWYLRHITDPTRQARLP